MDRDVDALTFDVSREIVELVIGRLLLPKDDELAASKDEEQDALAASCARNISMLKRNAVSLLTQQKDGKYCTQIRNIVPS